MTELTRRERLELILTYYILWKIKTEPKIVRKIIRHIHAPAKSWSIGDLNVASIADLGTKDHHLLDGLLDDDHTMYFHTDGTDAMTGDFDLAGNKLLTSNLLLKEENATTFAIKNRADIAYRNWMLDWLYAHYVEGKDSTSYFDTKQEDNSKWIFRARNNTTDVLTECARLVSAIKPYLSISRSGGIEPYEDMVAELGTTGRRYAGVFSPYIYMALDESGYIEYDDGDVRMSFIIADSEIFRATATSIKMESDMVVDCQSNGGELHPARESTAVGAEPNPSVHELFIWRDSTNNKVYLKYNDTDEGAKKVELT